MTPSRHVLLRIKLDDRTLLLPPPRAEMIVLGASASMITLLFIRSLYLLALSDLICGHHKSGGRWRRGGGESEGVGISMILRRRALADFSSASTETRNTVVGTGENNNHGSSETSRITCNHPSPASVSIRSQLQCPPA